MMKLEAAVKRETLYIAAWTLILSAVMQSVFLVAGLWKPDVLFGNLIAAFAAVANFFLMGITVQKAVDKEEKDAAQLMRFSQTLRMFMQIALGALGVMFFNPAASLLPLFFPRIAIVFRPLFDKKSAAQSEQQSEQQN